MTSRRFQTIALFSLLTMLVSAPAFAQRVPLWAVGMFEGYNRKDAAQVELTVRRDGQVIARNRYDNGRRDTSYGSWRNGRIFFGSTELDVDQIGDGIRLVQIGDRANVVRYQRID
jgi:hypothetical protein